MVLSETESSPVLERLDAAGAPWRERGDARPLRRWLEQELDPEGVPRRLSVPEWLQAVGRLDQARRARPGSWPEAFDAAIEGLVRALLRFSRPDGLPVFSPLDGDHVDAGRLLREWVARLPDAGLARVIDWWFPTSGRRTGRHAAPPLPAWSHARQPLSVLRADWSTEGGFITIDHRNRERPACVELFAQGRTWLGPTWSVPDGEGHTTALRLRHWSSSSSADLAEWAFRQDGRPIVRTALVLRGRQLALFGDQLEGGEPSGALSLGVPGGLTAEPVLESRGIALASRRTRRSVQVLPLGLPRLPYATERGSFEARDSALVLRQSFEGRRGWLPLLVSWNPARARKKVEWRPLTVSERARACKPGTAFAVRVTWGRDESLVIYRSLARPALRAFLGHQTRARFLIGLFTAQGDVKPIVKIDDPEAESS